MTGTVRWVGQVNQEIRMVFIPEAKDNYLYKTMSFSINVWIRLVYLGMELKTLFPTCIISYFTIWKSIPQLLVRIGISFEWFRSSRVGLIQLSEFMNRSGSTMRNLRWSTKFPIDPKKINIIHPKHAKEKFKFYYGICYPVLERASFYIDETYTPSFIVFPKKREKIQ